MRSLRGVIVISASRVRLVVSYYKIRKELVIAGNFAVCLRLASKPVSFRRRLVR